MADRRLTPTNRTFQALGDVPVTRIEAIEGVREPGLLTVQPLIVGERLMFLHCFKEKGLHDPWHQHDDHESIGYCLSGRMRVVIGEDEFIAEPGDAWYHAPGMPHYSETLADTVQLEMKSPPLRTWGDTAPSGPLRPEDWVRAVDPSGRRQRNHLVTFVKGSAAPTERIGAIEGVVEQGLLTITPLIVGQDMLFLSAFKEKGLHDPLHQHDDHESIGYCAKGRLRLVIGGEESIAGPGDAWYHAPGVPHFSEALEDTIQLEVKSPPMKTWAAS
jgi:quercetin dioxygenase-like cupin family protein